MTIAEFFVELGVKGSEKAVGALKGIKDGMSNLESTSLETKAAILGVVYGLQQMMSKSGEAGSNLTNFTALTGLSAKSLQQWQYAARQANVNSEEFTSSLSNVQKGIAKIWTEGKGPSGLGLIANTVGLDQKRLQDTFYLMTKLQEFALSTKVAPALGNTALESMGLSPNTIAAMRRKKFTPEVLNSAPIYSDNQIKSLDRVNIAWSNLGQKVQKAFGDFTSKRGMELVNEFSQIAVAVIKLATAFDHLAQTLKLFPLIGKIFEGWAGLFEESADTVESLNKSPKQFLKNVWSFVNTPLEEPDKNATTYKNFLSRPVDNHHASYRGHSGPTQVNVKQDLHFQHDGKDHRKNMDSHRKATQHAFRQNGALRGGF